jgi:hypothetical protein
MTITLLFSCKKEGHSTITSQEVTTKYNDSLQKNNWTLKVSSKYTGDWIEIITFEDELKRVLNSNIQSEKDLELLKKLIDDLKKTYPERYKTPTIEARVKVLDTEILMLEQDLKDGFLTDVFNKKKRIQHAYNVFVGQIEALIFKERDYEKYN